MELSEFVDAVMPTVGQQCAHPGTERCPEWADHQCADDTARCQRHCTCPPPPGAPRTWSVTITETRETTVIIDENDLDPGEVAATHNEDDMADVVVAHAEQLRGEGDLDWDRVHHNIHPPQRHPHS